MDLAIAGHVLPRQFPAVSLLRMVPSPLLPIYHGDSYHLTSDSHQNPVLTRMGILQEECENNILNLSFPGGPRSVGQLLQPIGETPQRETT